jgi:hypothetical protein
MGVSLWLAEHWLDLAQTAGIIGGLLFTAHALRRDEKARAITNTIAVNEQYSQIWHEFYARPELARILKKDVDLNRQPVSNDEALFVKIQGLQKDIRDFLTLPIPKSVWEKIKPFQDGDFVAFVERCVKHNT